MNSDVPHDTKKEKVDEEELTAIKKKERIFDFFLEP